MPRRRPPEPPFSVKLTQAQRKAVAEIAPELAERLKPDDRGQRAIPLTLAELKAVTEKARRALRQAGTGRGRIPLRAAPTPTFWRTAASRGRMCGAAGSLICCWARSEAMTEAEWLEGTHPQKMLEFLRGKVSDRKLRLFAVACWWRGYNWLVSGDCLATREDGRFFREVAERAVQFADGQATAEDLRVASEAVEAVLDPDYREEHAAVTTALPDAWDVADQTAMLIRDFFGKLASDQAWADGANDATQRGEWYRAVAEEGREQARLLLDIFGNPFRPVAVDPSWLTSNVVAFARTSYEGCTFDLLPILADALEEAGCDNAEALAHCRQPGEHVRGCWMVDLLLGKE
jgi:hypothetical protein